MARRQARLDTSRRRQPGRGCAIRRRGVARLAVSCLAALLAASLFVCTAPMVAHAQGTSPPAPDGFARLVVITNFDSTEIEINGVSYPYEWIVDGLQGVLVPPDRTYEIKVAASETQQRTFRVRLDNRETRVLVVDIDGMGERTARDTSRRTRRVDREEQEGEEEDDDDDDEMGFLGVSSSPRGVVYVDGESTGRRTPARRIEVEPGRHEVKIYYDEEGEFSETKHVLIRGGVNTNVFFRLRRTNDDQGGPAP